jgi:hypothetical protein
MSDDTQTTTIERDMDAITRRLLAAAIEKFGGADEFRFSASTVALPSGEGVAFFGAIMISLPNPLVGTGDMVRTLVVQDTSGLRDPEVIDELVRDAVAALRDNRAQLLGAAPATTSPGGLILP